MLNRPRLLGRSLVVVCVLALARVFAQNGQSPARDTTALPATGAGAISGRVVTDDATARPVRRAIVSLTAGGVRLNRTAVSGDDGRFAFASLPSGRYSLTAQRAGYIEAYYGSTHPGRPPYGGAGLTLAAGQQLTDVSLRLLHGSAISGTVRDQSGRPAENAQVQVLQFRTQNGERTLNYANVSGSSSSSTDDRGAYRLYGLPPGEYVVAVIQRSNEFGDVHLTADISLTVAAEARAKAIAAAASTGGRGGVQIFLGGEAPVAYAAVYFPGTTDAMSASPIALGPNEDREGVDITIQLVKTARIDGTVTLADGGAPGNAMVTLVSATGAPMGLANNFGARIQPTGAFSILNVTPGQYRLLARGAGPGPGPGAMAGVMLGPLGGRANGMPARTLWGVVDLEINGSDVTGISVPLQRGMTLSGHLVVEGAPLDDMTRASVGLASVRSAINGMSFASPNRRVDANGDFTFDGLMPGTYQLTANAPLLAAAGRGAPMAARGAGPAPAADGADRASGWMTKSIVVNGTDVTDTTVEIQAGRDISGVVVTLTDQVTELSGTILNGAGKPLSDDLVVVFSADRKFWGQSRSRRMRSPMRPNADGVFRVIGLPPGDYLIGLLSDFDQNDLDDAKFYEALAPASVQVTLAPGEKKVQDFKLAGDPTSGRGGR